MVTFLQNPKTAQVKEVANPTPQAIEKNPKRAANHQTVFSCHLCPYEAISSELIVAHLDGAHNQIVLRSVKLENVDDVNVSSTMGQEIPIKYEPDCSMQNYGVFTRSANGRPQTVDAYIDLTDYD